MSDCQSIVGRRDSNSFSNLVIFPLLILVAADQTGADVARSDLV